MTALSVAVLAGGPSSEAAVSRVSAAAVTAALLEAGHRPEVLELSAKLAGTLLTGVYDVAFPVTHGPLGEDGCLQGLLEVLDLPYVGSGVLASALAASKPHAKTIFGRCNLPVAEQALVWRGDALEERARQIRSELGGAVVAKPASGGSAIGVTRVAGDDADTVLVEALRGALLVDECVLVERFLAGHEVTCGVFEEDERGVWALPVTLILSQAAEWYDFKSKYAAGGSQHRCPAGFSEPVTARIQELAVAAHRALGARDLSRVDFVLGRDDDPGSVTILEVNTLPGMTATSLYPEAAGTVGIDFPSLCDRLVRRAYARPRRQTPDVVPMP
jgi:D-alanine-D-alanine ligase